MKNFYFMAGFIKELMNAGDEQNGMVRDLTIQLWSDLHGIISLYNSRVLYEVDKNSQEALQRRVDNLIKRLKAEYIT